MTLNESQNLWQPAGGEPRVDRERDDFREIGFGTRAGQMPYADHIFTCDLTDLEVHGGRSPTQDHRVSVQHETPSEYTGLLLAGGQNGQPQASPVG